MIHLVKEVSRGDEDDDGGALKETGRGKEGKKIKPKGQAKQEELTKEKAKKKLPLLLR